MPKNSTLTGSERLTGLEELEKVDRRIAHDWQKSDDALYMQRITAIREPVRAKLVLNTHDVDKVRSLFRSAKETGLLHGIDDTEGLYKRVREGNQQLNVWAELPSFHQLQLLTTHFKNVIVEISFEDASQ